MPNRLPSTALLGLMSSLTWGLGDFCGGLAARRISAVRSALLINLTGGIAAAIIALLMREPFPTPAALGWAVGAGAVGAAGLTLLYHALASGRMEIAAPMTGVLAAGVPVIFAAFAEGLPGPLQFVGFGVALGGIWLAAASGGTGGYSGNLWVPALAGLGFGLFSILIDHATERGVFWPLAVEKLSSLILLLAVSARQRAGWGVRGRIFGLLLLAGLFDMSGNVFFMLAARTGRLDVAAVLSSLYPATTALAAQLFLREPLTKAQAGGIGLLLVAIPMIAR